MRKKQLKKSLEDNSKLLKEIEALIDASVIEISKIAESENYRPLMLRTHLRLVLQSAYYGPKNQPMKAIEDTAGLPHGTLERWLNNARYRSCRAFEKIFRQLKGDKDLRINKTLTKEAIENPKFGLEYQKATDSQNYRGQSIEIHKSEDIRVTITDIKKLQLEISQIDAELRNIGLDPSRSIATSPETVGIDAEIVQDIEGESAALLPTIGETSTVP